jgi:ribosomal protein L22
MLFERLSKSFNQLRLSTTANSSSASSLIDAALKDAQAKTTNKAIPYFSTGNLKTSPFKLNHLAKLIHGMSLQEASLQMKMVIKKRGKDVGEMLHRAGCALEHNYGKSRKDYYIKRAWVGKGVFLKRLRIHGRGRTGRMTRPTAHLKIELVEKGSMTPEAVEMRKLVRLFKKDRLFVSLKDKQPVLPVNPVWSTKSWKYITSKKWIEPQNALKIKRTAF